MKTNDISSEAAAEKLLDSFTLKDRMSALECLRALAGHEFSVPYERVNMHIHSFFSYNTNGYSPSHIAWESRKAGLYAAGLCDFDVLDGLEEFFIAGQVLGLRTTVNMETRAFLAEYAEVDINSPGEPGVTYIMGAGFSRNPDADSPEAATLAQYHRQANNRIRAIVQRINTRLPEIAIDYEKEVVSLTPAGSPTERHIVRAYRLKAESVFSTSTLLHEFWGTLMKQTPLEIEKLYMNIPAIENSIRAILVKAGGVGYEKPTEKTFPPVDGFIKWALNCGAIPMITWLDGTSKGEENIIQMLECMKAKGACAVNIIPDRNHNIPDPDMRAVKIKKLAEVIRASENLGMPINIGTEMNKDGQPFADDTQCEALRPYHEIFLRGARIMVGHTWLSRFADFPYTSDSAEAEFRTDTIQKNRFFASVGSLPPITASLASQLAKMGQDKAFAYIRDSANNGAWAQRPVP